MALTVADDFVTLLDMESPPLATTKSIGGVTGPNQAANVFVEKLSSYVLRVTGTGLGGLVHDLITPIDMTRKHLMIWGRTLDPVSDVGAGWLIFIGNDATATQLGLYAAGGLSDTRISVRGFFNFCVDLGAPFFGTPVTPPPLNSVQSVGIQADHITATNRVTFFADEIKYGTGITVTGGAVAPRGSAEISNNDDTEGRGTFISISGVFYILSGITIGDVSGLDSVFDDSGETWVFQGQNVSSSYYVVDFVGGTGTNRCTFGTSTGTGRAKEGSGGNTFKSAGNVPFHFHMLDNKIVVEHFGCNFSGPKTLKKDPVRWFTVEDFGTGFTEDTRDANNSTANDAPCFPSAQITNDSCYFGHDVVFDLINIDLGTVKTGTWSVTWEYWNGTSWGSLIDVTDGTADFSVLASQVVSYAIPVDWAKNLIDTQSMYWIRARISSFTSSGTTPSINEVSVSIGGRIRMESSASESIRTIYTHMDTISVRNGASLKKATISNSLAPAKSAALDFGDTPTATDTVFSIFINGGINGVVLKPSGNKTYQFDDIKFAGLTGKKVRIEATAGTLIIISILNGGDALSNPADLDLVGGIVSADVTITNDVLFVINSIVSGTNVYIEATAGGPLTTGTAIFGPVIENTTTFSRFVSFTGDQPFRGTLASGTVSPFYVPFSFTGTIKSTGFTITAAQQLDE